MNYNQAKMAAIDYGIKCPKKLRSAASKLLSNLEASQEDQNDACELIRRAQNLEKAQGGAA